MQIFEDFQLKFTTSIKIYHELLFKLTKIVDKKLTKIVCSMVLVRIQGFTFFESKSTYLHWSNSFLG